MRSNEKSCVCNVFATPYSKNPVKLSLSSYANDNHTFWNVQFQKNFQLLRTLVLGSFYVYFKGKCDKITVLQKYWRVNHGTNFLTDIEIRKVRHLENISIPLDKK